MIRILLFIAAFIIPTSSFAAEIHLPQGAQLPESTITKISRDMADLQRIIDNAPAILKSNGESHPIAGNTNGNAAIAQVITLTNDAPVYTGASSVSESDVLMDAKAGDDFKAVSKEGDSYKVKLGKSVNGYKYGYVKASDPAFTISELLPETDLSEVIYNAIAGKISSMIAYYNNDPLIYVSGFSVELAYKELPKVSIDFEFRKPKGQSKKE